MTVKSAVETLPLPSKRKTIEEWRVGGLVVAVVVVVVVVVVVDCCRSAAFLVFWARIPSLSSFLSENRMIPKSWWTVVVRGGVGGVMNE